MSHSDDDGRRDPPERRLPRFLDPKRSMAPSGRPPAKGSAWIGRLTLLAVALLLVALLLGDLGDRGPSGPRPGTTVPDFAAPLATSGADRRVNLLQQPSDGVPRACDVRGPQVLNVCDLRRRPFVLAFFATEGERCIRQLDVLDRVRRRHPGLAVAAVALRGDREDVARLVRERRWGFPVGHDEEGFLVSLYGVAVCPQLVLGRAGGAIRDTLFGELGPEELDAQLAALERRG
jgi:hypothetical protein